MNFFTIPNLISAIRIALVPVFLWLLIGLEEPAAAGWLFAFIAATDWVDGYLARRLGQVSKVGEFLDPLADRLAVVAALIGGLITGDLPRWFAALVLAREVAIGFGALYLGLRSKAKLEVRWIGKLATALVYTSITWFFVAAGWDWDLLEVAAWVTGIPGLILYYVTLVQYLGDVKRTVAAPAG